MRPKREKKLLKKTAIQTKKMVLRRFVPHLRLDQQKSGDEILLFDAVGTGGVSPPCPKNPSRAETSASRYLIPSPLATSPAVCFALGAKTGLAGCGQVPYAVSRCFTHTAAVQRRSAARTCRIRSARLLAALKPPLRTLYGRAGTRLRYRHTGAAAP